MDINYQPTVSRGLSGKRVVGRGGTEKEAPTLMINFSCPKCFGIAELDAYKGVPICPRCPGRVFLKAQRIIRHPDDAHPLDDIRRLRRTDSYGTGVM